MDEADYAECHQQNTLMSELCDLHDSVPRVAVTSWEEGPIFCEECGERIPDARRKAIPGTLYCVDCAEALYN